MQATHELQQDLVLAKTYLAHNLNEGISLGEKSLKLSREEIVELYLDSLKEIVAEYPAQEVNDSFPEIPYVFSSPTFRLILSRRCNFSYSQYGTTTQHDPNGIYFSSNNAICISLEHTLINSDISVNVPFDPSALYNNSLDVCSLEANPLENFKIWFKELLRHEFHHASKSILHAAFLMQPEVVIPCKYNTGFSFKHNSPDNSGPVSEKSYHNYNEIVNLDEIMQPLFPFYDNTSQLDYFKNHLKTDLFTLKDRVSTDLELQALIKTHYRNAFDICTSRNHPNEGIFQSFINSLECRVNHVKNTYHCISCHIYETDAFLFGSLPYPLYRKIFTGLESTRVQEYLKFKGRAELLNICHVPFDQNGQSSINPEKMSECLSKICKEDFIIDEFLKELITVLRYRLLYDIRCDFNDKDCFHKYIKNTTEVDPFNPEFLNSMNRTRLDQDFIDRGWCVNKCKSLEDLQDMQDLQRGFHIQLFIVNGLKLLLFVPKILIGAYNLLSPWPYLLGAFLFAFRKEIYHSLQSGSNKKAFAAQRKCPESVMNEFRKKAGMSMTEMYLRMALPLDLSLVYDITTSTKIAVKTDIAESIVKGKLPNNRAGRIRFLIKSVAKGTAKSLKDAGWRYCAGPLFSGFTSMVQGLKQGFQKKGVCGSIVVGTEIMATQIIPAGEPLLTAQEDLLRISDQISSRSGFNFEPCNPQPVLLQRFNNRRTSVVPGSTTHEARSLFESARNFFHR